MADAARRPAAWSPDRSDKTAMVPFTTALRPIDLTRLRGEAEARSMSPELLVAELVTVWLATVASPRDRRENGGP
jgi:hypothetical protein